MNTLERHPGLNLHILIKNVIPLFIYAIGNIGITLFVSNFLNFEHNIGSLAFSSLISLIFSAPFFFYYGVKVGKMKIPGSYDIEFYDEVTKIWRRLDLKERTVFLRLR